MGMTSQLYCIRLSVQTEGCIVLNGDWAFRIRVSHVLLLSCILLTGKGGHELVILTLEWLC